LLGGATASATSPVARSSSLRSKSTAGHWSRPAPRHRHLPDFDRNNRPRLTPTQPARRRSLEHGLFPLDIDGDARDDVPVLIDLLPGAPSMLA
jgi:hypothetical protein